MTDLNQMWIMPEPARERIIIGLPLQVNVIVVLLRAINEAFPGAHWVPSPDPHQLVIEVGIDPAGDGTDPGWPGG